MRLAIACGRHDVDAMLESMTAQQFNEWIAYYQLEPYGHEAVKDVIATAASAICHALGAKVTPWMILGRDEPQAEVSPNQAAAIFRGRHGDHR